MPGAVVHEWIENTGGAEKVLDAMLDAFPESEVTVLWNDRTVTGEFAPRESWIARTPLRRHKAIASLILPIVWRTRRAKTEYDWVLVSSHLFAHHVKFLGKASPKLVYAHTPARYIWKPELDTRGANPLVRIASIVLRPLDRWRAKEAVSIAANSNYVAERIRECWGREARVIYPPVDVERIISVEDWSSLLEENERDLLKSMPERFLLAASRFVEYKNIEQSIRAAKIAGYPIVVAGRGPQEARLRAVAKEVGADAYFVISPSDAMLFALYQTASVFLFPVIEDFGIMPVEAMAAGCPVVGLAEGGTGETVIEGVSGSLSVDASPLSVANAVERAVVLDRSEVRRSAERFSRSRFIAEVKEWVDQEVYGG